LTSCAHGRTGSGFQPRLYDDRYKATFFLGWKPLPRKIDVTLMTLTPNLMKFHKSGASGQKNGQSDQKRN
jgi:hypothetical protein